MGHLLPPPPKSFLSIFTIMVLGPPPLRHSSLWGFLISKSRASDTVGNRCLEARLAEQDSGNQQIFLTRACIAISCVSHKARHHALAVRSSGPSFEAHGGYPDLMAQAVQISDLVENPLQCSEPRGRAANSQLQILPPENFCLQ